MDDVKVRVGRQGAELRCLKACPGAEALEILRRIGASPRERASLDTTTCPDIFELTDGRFAVIGTDATEQLDNALPPDASRADYERIVVITRDTLLRAKADIPDA